MFDSLGNRNKMLSKFQAFKKTSETITLRNKII